jgi:hypothetical protein
MHSRRLLSATRVAAFTVIIAFSLWAFEASNALAGDHSQEPIVGLWEITVTSGTTVVDYVFSGWTSDGLEFDQDISPVLSGYVCYGHWIKLKSQTYGLTHPYFDYSPSTGIWAGTSGYFNYTVTVSNDGSTFTGKENGTDGVPGPNPYAKGGKPFSGYTLSATKIEVNTSLLP